MVLTIDVGNSNTSLAAFAPDGEMAFNARISTDHSKTADEFAITIKDILELYNVCPEKISGAIMSCVVPPVRSAFAQAVQMLVGKMPLVVGPGLKTGIRINIDNPAQLGADIVSDAVAAVAKYKGPMMVVDMGTATSLSFIDAEGNYLGCALMPGMRLSLNALSEKAAQLPHISIETPMSVVGKNTVDSMRSGLVFGTAGMIDAIADRAEKELGKLETVVLTGGNARYVHAACRREVIYNPNLILEGLCLLYRKNTGIKA